MSLRNELLETPMALKVGINVLHAYGGDSTLDHHLQHRHDHHEFEVINNMSVRAG